MLLFQLARVSSIDKWSSFYKGKKFHKFTPNRMGPKPSSRYRDIGDGKPLPRLNTGSEDVGEIPENLYFYIKDILNSCLNASTSSSRRYGPTITMAVEEHAIQQH